MDYTDPRTTFDKPVRVVLGKNGNIISVISRPEQAAEKLLYEWPGERGSKHLAARTAVLKAMENAHDRTLRAQARKAFEAAAKDAGILMPEPPSWRKLRR